MVVRPLWATRRWSRGIVIALGRDAIQIGNHGSVVVFRHGASGSANVSSISWHQT